MPSPEWKLRVLKTPWYAGETVSVAIGQGQVSATPLQMARVAAVIANGGFLVTPHLVRAAPAGERTAPPPRPLGISPETMAAVKEGMRAVVAEGTGWRARLQTGRGVRQDGLGPGGVEARGSRRRPTPTSCCPTAGSWPSRRPRTRRSRSPCSSSTAAAAAAAAPGGPARSSLTSSGSTGRGRRGRRGGPRREDRRTEHAASGSTAGSSTTSTGCSWRAPSRSRSSGWPWSTRPPTPGGSPDLYLKQLALVGAGVVGLVARRRDRLPPARRPGGASLRPLGGGARLRAALRARSSPGRAAGSSSAASSSSPRSS